MDNNIKGNNKSDFYKKAYSEKIDTSNIKTYRNLNNNKNTNSDSKKNSIYADDTGIYKVSHSENLSKLNKSNNFFKSKILFLMGVASLFTYVNDTNPKVIQELISNFKNTAEVFNISQSSTPNIITSGLESSIAKIKHLFNIDNSNNNTSIIQEEQQSNNINFDDIAISIPSISDFNFNNSSDLESNSIKIDEATVNKMLQEISDIGKTNFIEQNTSQDLSKN